MNPKTSLKKDKPYRALQQLFARHPIGAPDTDTFTEILKFYYEPEEAHLATHMTWDLEPEEVIAKRAGMSLDEASRLLTTMASKFFIRGIKRPDGVRVFRLLYILPGLYETPFVVRQPSPDLDRLGDLWERYFAEAQGREMHSGSIQLVRALPAIEASKDQVLPYEDAVQIVQKASFVNLLPCACRQAARNCDDPLDVCMVLSDEFRGGDVPGEAVLNPSQMVGAPPRVRQIPVDEAVEVLKQSAQAGLVHCTMNVKGDSWLICNCCRHACHGLRGITQLDIPHAVAPSSYWVTVDEDLCNGCSACVERCHVDAIEMNDNMVAEIDYERCLGCGVCTFVCAPEALRLEKRDDRIFTPATDAHELLVMLGASKGRPYPVHHHPHV
ncbi:MAG: 4Fe-4S binding protein [Dehalococcoidia bacterium]|nr:MAG: 4Fe-4S binding protein [Dehalococcoidia bacterium]